MCIMGSGKSYFVYSGNKMSVILSVFDLERFQIYIRMILKAHQFVCFLVQLLQLIVYILQWDRLLFRDGLLVVETPVVKLGKASPATI